MADFLATMYEPYADERQAFGRHWRGPKRFEHFEGVLVAKYEAKEDGAAVEVYCEAAPARFYRLTVLDADGNTAYEISTGSGQHEMAAKMAEMIADGMLVVRAHGEH